MSYIESDKVGLCNLFIFHFSFFIMTRNPNLNLSDISDDNEPQNLTSEVDASLRGTRGAIKCFEWFQIQL
jgi:hypothetical protein